MATFLDASLLGHFTSLFTFLFVFVVIFGLLEVFQFFGKGKAGLHALAAVAIGFTVLVSKSISVMIQTMTPWFTVLIIMAFFMIFIARFVGASEKDVAGTIKNGPVSTWIIIFAIIIVLYSASVAFGQSTLEEGPGGTAINENNTNVQTTTTIVNGQPVATPSTATNSYSQNFYNTFYHPKVLGLLLILIITTVAVILLSTKAEP